MIIQNEKLEVIKEILDDMDEHSTAENIDSLLSIQDRCISIMNIYPKSNVYKQIIEHIFIVIGNKIENCTVEVKNECK
jgi:NDP-sugar pyrophosphorylase family protein